MTSGLLMDTCAAIWVAEGQSISEEALQALDNVSEGGLYVSPITAWEVGMLVRKGRLTIRATAQHWFRALLQLPGMRLADLTPDILIEASFLPGVIHNDPADRIVVSTARSNGLTILTRDRRILEYAEQDLVMALAC